LHLNSSENNFKTMTGMVNKKLSIRSSNENTASPNASVELNPDFENGQVVRLLIQIEQSHLQARQWNARGTQNARMPPNEGLANMGTTRLGTMQKGG
jgi:hypothetical protein